MQQTNKQTTKKRGVCIYLQDLNNDHHGNDHVLVAGERVSQLFLARGVESKRRRFVAIGGYRAVVHVRVATAVQADFQILKRPLIVHKRILPSLIHQIIDLLFGLEGDKKAGKS